MKLATLKEANELHKQIEELTQYIEDTKGILRRIEMEEFNAEVVISKVYHSKVSHNVDKRYIENMLVTVIVHKSAELRELIRQFEEL